MELPPATREVSAEDVVQPPNDIQSTILETKIDEAYEKMNQSVDSGKSTLEDSNEEETAAPTGDNTSAEKEQSDPHSLKEDNIEDDDLDDDKSSSCTSSSSSSSSSDSDSSDDEVKEEKEESTVRTEENVEHQKTNVDQKPISTEEIIPPQEQSNGAPFEKNAGIEMEESDSKSRLEIDDSFAPNSEDEGGHGEVNDDDGATITKSDGLKLSISLKRPILDEKPKESAEVLPSVNSLVQPQPVDFSNFLKQEKLLAERSQLVKIEYNSKSAMHNISDQLERTETEKTPSNPNAPGGYSLLNNQLKTNYVGVNTADFLMEESSDTLDEENRLVIAEKQRKGRKKEISPPKQHQSQQQLLQTWQPALREAMQPGLMRQGLPPKNIPKKPQQPRQQQTLMKTALANNKISQQHQLQQQQQQQQQHQQSHQQQHQQPQYSSTPPIAPTQLQQRHQYRLPPQSHSVPPQQAEKKKDKKKVFLCSPCGTHYENWNLFKHMREVHKKYICLYCLGIFQSAERLVNHLEAKHQVRKKHVSSIDEYQQQQQPNSMDGNKSLYLMCARCEHIFEKTSTADEGAIVQHNCADYMEKCDNCGCLKQSKHKCDKKTEQPANVAVPPKDTARQMSSSLNSINHINSNAKLNLNNNYNNSTSNSTTSVMFTYDNQAKMSNGGHDARMQFNKSLPGQQKIQNRSGPNKRAKFSQRQKNVDLTSPLSVNTQLSQSLLSRANQTSKFPTSSYNSPILQSQLMKPLETAAQLPNSLPTAYPTDLVQQQSSNSPVPQFTHQQANLLQLPPQLTEAQQSAQGLNFNQITTLSTIPASLLNVREAPSELPPVPELPVPEQPGHKDPQREQEKDELSRPLLVPKLKVRIPKQFCTPIESEESSTESDYDEEGPDEQEDDDEDEQDSARKAQPNKAEETAVS